MWVHHNIKTTRLWVTVSVVTHFKAHPGCRLFTGCPLPTTLVNRYLCSCAWFKRNMFFYLYFCGSCTKYLQVPVLVQDSVWRSTMEISLWVSFSCDHRSLRLFLVWMKHKVHFVDSACFACLSEQKSHSSQLVRCTHEMSIVRCIMKENVTKIVKSWKMIKIFTSKGLMLMMIT